MMTSYHSWALQKVTQERMRQERLKHEGKFPFTSADIGLSSPQRLAMLVEEVGEVANEIMEAINNRIEVDFPSLIDELTQVAAISTGWLEHLLEYHDSTTRIYPCNPDETDQLPA